MSKANFDYEVILAGNPWVVQWLEEYWFAKEKPWKQGDYASYMEPRCERWRIQFGNDDNMETFRGMEQYWLTKRRKKPHVTVVEE